MAENLIGNSDPQTLNMLAQLAQQYGGYGAVPAIQRSQYLADALKSIGESASSNIKTVPALGTNLLAEALLQFGRARSDKDLLKQITQGQQQFLSGMAPNVFGPQGGDQNQPPAPPPPPPQSAGFAAQPPPQAPSAQAAPRTLDPRDLEAAARAVWGEARGEGARGEQAVAGVIANRAQMSGLPIAQIVAQPHQFAGYSPRAQALSPNDPQLQQIEQTIAPVLMGQAPNPAGGADHFYAPRGMPGGATPSWAQGQPQTPIGNQNFLSVGFGGHPPMQPGAMPQSAPPAPQAAPMAQPAAQPQNGAPAPPQAPQGPMYATGPFATPQETAIIRQGLSAPPGSALYNHALQLMSQIQQRTTTPTEWKPITINGAPAMQNPWTGETRMGAIPREAMQQDVPNAEGFPRGSVVQRGPTGQLTYVHGPPEGYQDQNGRLTPEPGGPADPTAGQQGFTNRKSIQSEYTNAVTPFLNQQSAYQQIQATAGNSSHAGQIAMIMAFSRLANPQARIGSPEQAMAAADSGALPSFVSTALAKLMGGPNTLLAPEEERQFRQTAEQIWGDARQRAGQTFGYYASQDPTHSLQPFPGLGPEAAQPHQAQTPAGGYRVIQVR